ncbi:BA75_04030T0 [Komagataella pastoris]|uniref:Maintenance of telomere capping protein 6 n=1 Tax=Komagataella pastoris TaxID=4922 RepID=A0A1B2JGP5_PICPA|nr:BA75_04030T0 [Komagataella pastoris]
MIIPYFLLIQCVYCVIWPPLTIDNEVALRSQRDISYNVSVDQLVDVGVRLSTVLFERDTYTQPYLNQVDNLLNASVGNILIDAYWDEEGFNWQLCPAPFSANVTPIADDSTILQLEWDNKRYACDTRLDLSSVFTRIDEHIRASARSVSLNLITIYMILHSIGTRNSTPVHQPGTLSRPLVRSIDQAQILTPASLRVAQLSNSTYQGLEFDPDGYPILGELLQSRGIRVIPIILENNLYGDTSYDLERDSNIYFIQNSTINVTQTSTADTESTDFTTNMTDWTIADSQTLLSRSFRLIMETEEDPFSLESYINHISRGYSPFLNRKYNESEIRQFAANRLWSWKNSYIPEASIPLLGDPDDSNSANETLQCASFSNLSWFISSCDQQRQVACRSSSDWLQWTITSTLSNYYGATDVCPAGTFFDVPRTPLDSLTLQSKVPIDSNVWIDLNTLSSGGCWISGGAEAQCPYHRVTLVSLYVEILTPSSVVSIVLIATVILLHFVRIPIQKNRKYWRKLQENIKDSDGIPS